MRKLAILLTVFVATACKTPCSDPGSIASQLSAGLGKLWQCKRVDLMQADYSVALEKVNFCAASANQPTGVVGSLVCPLAVAEIRNMTAGLIVKPEYECNMSLVGAGAAAALEAACNLIPF